MIDDCRFRRYCSATFRVYTVSYKVYINKDSKPVIRRVEKNRFFNNPVINRVLVLSLCITAALIVGMRYPELQITRHEFEAEIPHATVATGFPFNSFSRPNQIGPAAEIIPTSKEEILTTRSEPAAERTESGSDDASESGNEDTSTWESLIIQPGDNLSLIFDRQDISRQDLDSIMSLGKDTAALKNLMPGHELRLRHSAEHLDALEYDINLINTIHVTRQEDIFSAVTVTTELETRINQAFGVISDSLFLSAQRAGISDNLIMQLIDIYGWDIDFALDIREGDRFFILYEEKFKNGIKVQDGPILAAEFINQNHPFQAVRYADADGYSNYYNEEGFSMRKAFLRTPVNFTRISSGFSLARKHPILNRIRAHKGVDYAAPIGTPVKATGDGTVAFAGTSGGYGKMIVLRHGEKYSTVYGHLTRFAKDITAGKRISQGQIIGFVGMTGLATGPHLHYEFRINDVHHDPLTVQLPKALGIPQERMSDFKAHTQPLLAQLVSAMANTTQPPKDYKPVVAFIKGSGADRVLE